MREPNLVLRREDGGVYLKRWWIIPRNRFLNLYLHQFIGSDDDRALHDHPWWFVSWIVKGQYLEYARDRVIHRKRWSIAFRPADWAHRVELEKGLVEYETLRWPIEREIPVWTIVITGPRARTWGFYCPKGWIPWMQFDKQGGCE